MECLRRGPSPAHETWRQVRHAVGPASVVGGRAVRPAKEVARHVGERNDREEASRLRFGRPRPGEQIIPPLLVDATANILGPRLGQGVPAEHLRPGEVESAVRHLGEVVDHIQFAGAGAREEVLEPLPRIRFGIVVLVLAQDDRPRGLHEIPFQHKYSRLAQPSPGARRYERTGLGGSEASFRGCQLMPRAAFGEIPAATSIFLFSST
jgi:hypothetical protein